MPTMPRDGNIVKRLIRKAKGKDGKRKAVDRAPLLFHGQRSPHFDASTKTLVPLRDDRDDDDACDGGTEDGTQATERTDAKELTLEPWSERFDEPPAFGAGSEFPRGEWSTPRWTEPSDRGAFEPDWDLAAPPDRDGSGNVEGDGDDDDEIAVVVPERSAESDGSSGGGGSVAPIEDPPSRAESRRRVDSLEESVLKMATHRGKTFDGSAFVDASEEEPSEEPSGRAAREDRAGRESRPVDDASAAEGPPPEGEEEDEEERASLSSSAEGSAASEGEGSVASDPSSEEERTISVRPTFEEEFFMEHLNLMTELVSARAEVPAL